MRVSSVVAMWQSAELWCLPVVVGGEGRVDASGLVSGEEQRLAQWSIACLGRWAVVAVAIGRVEGWNETAEGADAGEGLEAVGVAEPGEDLGAVDGGDAGDGGHDPAGVEVVEEDADACS